jgi:hypothetical protein
VDLSVIVDLLFLLDFEALPKAPAAENNVPKGSDTFRLPVGPL